MRAWLFVLAVLATLNNAVQRVSTEEVASSSNPARITIDSLESSSTLDSSSSNSVLSDNLSSDRESSSFNREKPDPQTLVQIEKNLLSLFGFHKRPKVDRSKIVIPEAMKELYAQIMGHELDSTNVPKEGLHTKNANTVRSFTHEGNYQKKFQLLEIQKR